MKIKKERIKKIYILGVIAMCFGFFCVAQISHSKPKLVSTNANIENIESLNNKKIGWGIKRADNHNQPDVGAKNKEILDKYNGICIGNSNTKKVYLTFDEGYEAGYTEEILKILKENDVKACFFITAHYLNTKPELVQKMIDEGHIVGNHTPNYLMSEVLA